MKGLKKEHTYNSLYTCDPAGLDFIIDDLLAPGVYILAGSPKVGKTWMALDIAVSVTEGSSFLGRKSTKGSVLYLSYDDSEGRISRRLKRMDRGDNKDIIFDFESKTVDSGLQDYIISKKDCMQDLKLVIIDVLHMIRDDKGSSYSKDYEVVSKLKSLAEDLHICILLITHLTKESNENDPFKSICGSVGMTGCADGYMVITPIKDSEICKLDACGNDIGRLSEKVIFNDINMQWELYSFCMGKEGTNKELFLRALYVYLTTEKSEFTGTIEDLIQALGSLTDEDFVPAVVGKYLSQSASELQKYGIGIKVKRTATARLYTIIYDAEMDGFAKANTTKIIKID